MRACVLTQKSEAPASLLATPMAFISMVASHHRFDAELHAEFPSSRHFRVVHV